MKDILQKWKDEGISDFEPVTNDCIEDFQAKNKVVLPDDLRIYFNTLNGTGGQYTNDLFEFYQISKFQNVSSKYADWTGVPNYSLLCTQKGIQNLFVFADYSFNMFSYVIRLYGTKNEVNEVYVLCGENVKKLQIPSLNLWNCTRTIQLSYISIMNDE